jgi:hypothetical protein
VDTHPARRPRRHLRVAAVASARILHQAEAHVTSIYHEARTERGNAVSGWENIRAALLGLWVHWWAVL